MTHEELFTLCTKIAPHLAGVWSVTRNQYGTAATFSNGVLSFKIQFGSYGHQGKLTVKPAECYADQIYISPTRTPKAIAADITRRFLPALYERNRKTVEYNLQRNTERAEREQLLHDLNQASNFTLTPHSRHYNDNNELKSDRRHAPGLCVELNHENVITLTLQGISLIHAQKLITAFVTQYPNEKRCECGEWAMDGSDLCEDCTEELNNPRPAYQPEQDETEPATEQSAELAEGI